ncbi:MAG: type II secretion system F family protein [Pirellulaceae bacterium]
MMWDILWALGPPALVLAGFFLLWSTTWIRQRSAVGSRATQLEVIVALGWIILIGGVFVLAFVTGPVFSPLIWCVVLVVWIAGMVRFRRSEVNYLVWSLSEASGRGIPLENVARAFATEHGGRLAMRARRLADYLDAAMPLSLALSRSRMAVSPEVRLAADVGEKTGTLSQSLKKALQQVEDFERLLSSLFAKVSYLSWILLMMITILAFLMTKIVPVFEAMFREFDLRLPAITQLLISLSRGFMMYWFVVTPVLGLLGLAAVLLLLSYVGISFRGLPIVGRFFSAVDSAAILQLLAVAVRKKRPLVGSLELLAAYSRSPHARRRLHTAIRQIAEGAHWCDALQKAGFVTRAQSGVFKSAERAGNLAWALEEMADSTVRRSSYRAQAALNFLFPLMVLGCGMCVLFVALGILMPLFSLISSLT